MTKCAVALAALALFTPIADTADSDGYFCVGRGLFFLALGSPLLDR
jgi:hypothetical protein